VITRVLAAAGRHRRIIVVAGLLVSAGYLMIEAWAPSQDRWAFRVMSTADLVCLLLVIIVVVGWRQPRTFVVRPNVPAFGTPPHPAVTFMLLALFLQAAINVGNAIRDWGSEPFLDLALDLFWAPLIAVLIASGWPATSVQLRPEGLWQQGIGGWLVVPWDASPTVPRLPPPAYAHTVSLTYGRADLVRRTGIHVHGRRLRTTDIDPWLITAAIRYYVAYPEHRPAIGTKAEHDRLMSLLLDSLLVRVWPDVVDPSRPAE